MLMSLMYAMPFIMGVITIMGVLAGVWVAEKIDSYSERREIEKGFEETKKRVNEWCAQHNYPLIYMN